MMNKFDERIISQIRRAGSGTHKGQNGKLLVIGGSKLFHASIFWSADVASKIVDLVHFTSPANENNTLIRKKLKEGFWKGIVVDYNEVENYIAEDDCILIGPGMPREEGLFEGEVRTGEIVNRLLSKYGNKRWVVDGGALQELEVNNLNGNMIITPHKGEWEALVGQPSSEVSEASVSEFSNSHDSVTVILKGEKDIVCKGGDCVVVEGGNPGMTKGGTGDVLAGLVAALYCTNEAGVAACVGSMVNKKAGEKLSESVGEYFNASDLVEMVPKVLYDLVSKRA